MTTPPLGPCSRGRRKYRRAYDKREMKKEIIRLFLKGKFHVEEHEDKTPQRLFPFHTLSNAVPQDNAPISPDVVYHNNAANPPDDVYLSDDSSEDGEDSLDEEQQPARMPSGTKIMHFTRKNGSKKIVVESFRDLVPYIGEENIMHYDSQIPHLGLVDKLLKINPQLPPFCELRLFGNRLSTFVVKALLCDPEQLSRRGNSIRAYLMRMQPGELFFKILKPANLYNTLIAPSPPLHDPEVLKFILDLLCPPSLQGSVNTSIDQSHNDTDTQLPQRFNHMAELIKIYHQSTERADYIFGGFVDFWIALNTLPLANREICLQYPELLAQLNEFICTTIWNRPHQAIRFLVEINVAYSTHKSQAPSWQPLISSRKLDLESAVEQILCVNRGKGNPLGIIYPSRNPENTKIIYSAALNSLRNELIHLEPAQKSLLYPDLGESLREMDDYILMDLCIKQKDWSGGYNRDSYRYKPMLSREGNFGQHYDQAQSEYDKKQIIRIAVGGFIVIALVFVITEICKYISGHRISPSLGHASASRNPIYKASSK